jgi:hypothetical protein
MHLGRHPKLCPTEFRATTSPSAHAAPALPSRARSLVATWVTVAMTVGCRKGPDVPEPPPSTHAETPAHPSAPPSGPGSQEDDKSGPPPDPRVDAIVRSQIEPEAKRCYEAGLQKNAKESGTVVLLINVMSNGNVETVSAGADGSLAVDTVDCIQRVAKRAVFDAPGDAGRMVRVPFTFRR